ncbi:ABC transporter substrate-binding protein [Streptomyces sp. CB01635]|uniref:ABC transporter substrate-binding protein n=1 Tax=unclassified Streptomyces TaxID=2593676 RepID=UPI000C27E8CC|nr:ABC transporter substrate-binding protein [Streptomyces sp. CB01635]PJN13265.1 ABC transporter substrate-binding protein [Streptomyces sp. CB01635]
MERHAVWEFTDDRGHVAAAGDVPLRVVAYIQAGATLWDHGIRPVGIFGSFHDGDLADPAKAGTLPLDEVPYLGAGHSVGLEEVLAAEPDLVVAVTYGGGQVYGVDPDVAKHLEEHVPVVVVDIGQGRSLTAVRERFAELTRSLGARDRGGAELERTMRELEQTARDNTGRVLALSPGGPDSVHLARPAKWPDLSALTALGVRTVEPPQGPGANWNTTGWAQAAALAPDIVLVDSRANASPCEQYAANPYWQQVEAGARLLPWNPELPASESAHARFFDQVSRALRDT